MRSLALAALLLVACGGSRRAPVNTEPAKAPTPGEQLLALLPDGVQVLVEVDLARLRANAVVGGLVKEVLAGPGVQRVPGVAGVALGGDESPLANADTLVLASYGVGTAQAVTISLLETKQAVAGATKISPTVYALGPEEWIGQLQSRAAIAGITPDGEVIKAGPEPGRFLGAKPLHAPAALMRLRDHAMPSGATGAVIRITARLPFDARIALARQFGLDAAPAQLSLWADLADDFAMVIDADAADPGTKKAKDAARRLEATLRRELALVADTQEMRELGITSSLGDAHFVSQGTWVRTIVAIGPRHLQRVVERARSLLEVTAP